ncbi:hypothetical protein ACM66B_006583 [Microbotryomycetes sp. NB124-2]
MVPQGTAITRTSFSPVDSAPLQTAAASKVGLARRSILTSADPVVAATPARPRRPSSSLGQYSGIPAPASVVANRRRSSVSGIPVSSTVNTSVAAAATAASARSAASVDKELATLRSKLVAAEASLASLEDDKAREIQDLKTALQEVRENAQRQSKELERSESLREQMEQELSEGRDRSKAAAEDNARAQQEAREIKENVEGQLEQAQKQMNEQQQTIIQLEDLLSRTGEDFEALRDETAGTIDSLRGQKAELELVVMKLEDELHTATSPTSNDDVESLRQQVGEIQHERDAARELLEEQRLRTTKFEGTLEDLRLKHAQEVDFASSQVQIEIENAHAGRADAERAVKELEDGMAGAASRIDELERQNEELTRQLRDAMTERDETNLHNERARALEEEIVELGQQLEQASSDRDEALRQLDAARAEIATQAQALETANEELLATRQTLERHALDHREANDQAAGTISQLRQQLEDNSSRLDSQLVELTQQRDEALSKLKPLYDQLAQLEALSEARNTLQLKIDNQQRDINDLTSSLQDAELKIVALESQIKDRDEVEEEKVDGLQVVCEQLEQARNEIQDLEKRVREVQNVADEREHQANVDLREREKELERSEKAIADANEDRDQLVSQLELAQRELEEVKRRATMAGQEAETNVLDALQESNELRQQLAVERQKSDDVLAKLAEVQELHARLAAAETKVEHLKSELEDVQSPSREVESFVSTELTTGDSQFVEAEALVMRLRAERNDLRAQLEFSQTESTIKVESLQLQLIELRQAQEHFDTLTTSSLEQLRQTQDKLDQVEIELSRVRKEMVEANDKVVKFDELSRDAETLARELAESAVKVESLERELEKESEEKEVVGDAVESEVTIRCAELECEVEALQGRIARRTEQIGRQEQIIAALQAKLVAQDEGDKDDTVELSPRRSVQDNKVPVAELEQRLQDMTTQLNDLQAELRVVLDTQAELEDDLAEAREIVADADQRETTIQQQLAKLTDDKSELEHMLEDRQGEIKQLELQIQLKDADLVDVREQLDLAHQRHADIVGELEFAKSSFEALRPSLSAMEGRLEDSAQEQATLRTLLGDKEALVQELEQKLTMEGKSQNVEALQRELEALTSARTETDELHAQEISRLELQLDELSKSRDGMRSELDTVKAELGTARTKLTDTEQQANDLHAALSLAKVELVSSPSLAEVEQRDAKIASLENDLKIARTDLTEVLDALDAQERAARAELDDLARETEALSVDKERLSIELDRAQKEVADMENRLESLALQAKETDLVEEQLRDAQVEIHNLTRQLEQERQETDKARDQIDEAVRVERDALVKVQAALDAAMRENKTLRSLARTAESDVEALKAEITRLDQIAGLLEQDKRDLADKLQEVERKAQSDIREVLDSMQQVEQLKDEADKRVERLARELDERAAAGPSTELVQELEEQVKVMSNQLESKEAEIEETDEKYIEVLKAQKRHLAQIEKLKAKVSSLQRDLVTARAAVTTVPLASSVKSALAPTTPSSATTTLTQASSTSKKRRAPSEFEPPANATNQARAIVADVSSKENEVVTLPLSAKKLGGASDGVVPLKPAAIPSQPAREALKSVGGGGNTTLAQDKLADLRRRLALQQNSNGARVV